MVDPNKHVVAGIGLPSPVRFGNDLPVAFILGPCQMESRSHALMMAAAIRETATLAGVQAVFKASYDKANRTSLSGRRGIGMAAALEVFAEIREPMACLC